MRSEPHRASSASIDIVRVAQPVLPQTHQPPAASPFTFGHPGETLSNFFRYISIVGRFHFAGPNHHQITGRPQSGPCCGCQRTLRSGLRIGRELARVSR